MRMNFGFSGLVPALLAGLALAPGASAQSMGQSMGQSMAQGWTGPWVGGAVGMGSTNYSPRGEARDGATFLGSVRLPDFGGQGALATLSGGYDFDFGNGVVAGAMLDLTTTRINNRADISIPVIDGVSGSYRLRPRTMVTLAGRVGVVTSESTMVYGLLGYGQARFRANVAASDDFDSFGGSYGWRQNGPVIGAGIETQLAANTTLRLEYRYHRLGNHTILNENIFGVDVGLRTRTSVQTVQAGVNWRF